MGSFVTKLGNDVMAHLLVFMTSVPFVLAGVCWTSLLELERFSAAAAQALATNSIFNRYFHYVAKVILQTGVIFILMVVFLVMAAYKIFVRQEDHRRHVHGFLRMAVVLGLLFVMYRGASQPIAPGQPPAAGSPAWLYDTVTGTFIKPLATSIDGIATSLITPNVQGALAAPAPSCQAYLAQLDQDYAQSTQQANGQAQSNDVTAAAFSTLWASTVMQEHELAQFGEAPGVAQRVGCRQLEIAVSASPKQQRAITWALLQACDQAASDKNKWGHTSTRQVCPPVSIFNTAIQPSGSDINVAGSTRALEAWAICAWDPQQNKWVSYNNWFKHMNISDNGYIDWNQQCTAWFVRYNTNDNGLNGDQAYQSLASPSTIGGQPVDRSDDPFYYNHSGAVQSTGLTSYDAIATLNGPLGHDAASVSGVAMGISSLISSAAMIWLIGPMTAVQLIVGIGMVLWFMVLPVGLIAMAWPGEASSDFTRRYLRIGVSLLVADLVFTVVVAILVTLLNLLDAGVQSALGHGIAAALFMPIMPLVALLVVNKLSKAMGLGKLTGIGGTVALAGAGMNIGRNSLRGGGTAAPGRTLPGTRGLHRAIANRDQARSGVHRHWGQQYSRHRQQGLGRIQSMRHAANRTMTDHPRGRQMRKVGNITGRAGHVGMAGAWYAWRGTRNAFNPDVIAAIEAKENATDKYNPKGRFGRALKNRGLVPTWYLRRKGLYEDDERTKEINHNIATHLAHATSIAPKPRSRRLMGHLAGPDDIKQWDPQQLDAKRLQTGHGMRTHVFKDPSRGWRVQIRDLKDRVVSELSPQQVDGLAKSGELHNPRLRAEITKVQRDKETGEVTGISFSMLADQPAARIPGPIRRRLPEHEGRITPVPGVTYDPSAPVGLTDIRGRLYQRLRRHQSRRAARAAEDAPPTAAAGGATHAAAEDRPSDPLNQTKQS